MLTAFVPGRILRAAPPSVLPTCPILPCSSAMLPPGLFGPSWSSAIGGGLGSRGELEGDTAAIAIVGDMLAIAVLVCSARCRECNDGRGVGAVRFKSVGASSFKLRASRKKPLQSH